MNSTLCKEDIWLKTFKELCALWVHNGNPNMLHALLTSGKHSNVFFNATKITERPRIMKTACEYLMPFEAINKNSCSLPDRVIGSAFGSITIAHVFAEIFAVKSGFTEPLGDGIGKWMLLKRFSVSKGENILVVDDVVTTGDTTRKTINEIEGNGARVLPIIFVLVNRSNSKFLDGREIISLVQIGTDEWKPEECSLCKVGSEALSPKGNWGKLIAE